jgi:tetratricopeptide (TPR) repeat protein
LANWPEKLHNDVIACFSNAVDLNPLIEACTRLIDSGQADNRQLVATYLQRGFLQRLKQPDRALADYDAALKIQPDATAVLTNRAWIYMSRSRYDAALEDLNKAIALSPPALAAHSRYYRGYSFLRLKDYPSAMSDLNEALRVEPNNPDPYLARGETEQAQQLYDAALHDYDEFSKRAPRDPRGLIARGSVMEATGRAKEALAAYENAVMLDPANARALAARDRLRSAQNADGH